MVFSDPRKVVTKLIQILNQLQVTPKGLGGVFFKAVEGCEEDAKFKIVHALIIHAGTALVRQFR